MRERGSAGEEYFNIPAVRRARGLAVLTASAPHRDHGASSIHTLGAEHMTPLEKTRAIFTDSHFLICLVVFCAGLALLVLLH